MSLRTGTSCACEKARSKTENHNDAPRQHTNVGAGTPADFMGGQRSRRSRLARRLFQPLFHSPAQGFDPVLPEERLALKHRGGNAPMPGLTKGGVVRGQLRFMAFRIGCYRRIELSQVEAGAFGRLREM